MTIDKVNISEKFHLFNDHWNPRIVGELNDQQVKVVKMLGAFDWHHHQDEDEMFMVIKGTLQMEFRNRKITVGEGEFIIVPKGVEHRPVADQEVSVILFEPASTLNTGNVTSDRTKKQLEKI